MEMDDYCVQCGESGLKPLYHCDNDGILHETEGDRKWCDDCLKMVAFTTDFED